jgi:hypothetical protein
MPWSSYLAPPPDSEEEDERREDVAKKRLDEAVARLNEVGSLQALLESEAFRDFIWRVLSRCHIFASTYHDDPRRAALMEGERNIGLWVLKEVNEADPKKFTVMMEKAAVQASEDARVVREDAAQFRRNP